MKITKKGNVVLKLEPTHIAGGKMFASVITGRVVSFKASEIMKVHEVTQEQIEKANWNDFMPDRLVHWDEMALTYCKERVLRRGTIWSLSEDAEEAQNA